MRRRFVFVLILINCLLGIALLARSADSQIIPNGIFSCCEYEEGDGQYCCEGCCWWVQNCSDCS